MSGSAPAPLQHCAIVGGEKLLLNAGGANAICAEVERAIAARAPAAHYEARITVLSSSRLAATIVVGGRTLPVQNFAVMDRTLGETSIRHFADSIAAVVAEASKK